MMIKLYLCWAESYCDLDMPDLVLASGPVALHSKSRGLLKVTGVSEGRSTFT